jgi:membrane associated rhomboid family serine protease
MIKGDYDSLPGAYGPAANTALVIGWIGAWILFSGFLDAAWWQGALGGLVVGAIAGALVHKIVGPSKK